MKYRHLALWQGPCSTQRQTRELISGTNLATGDRLLSFNRCKRTNVMQLGSMFICNCNIAVHVSEAFCVHLQEHLEIVEAASGE